MWLFMLWNESDYWDTVYTLHKPDNWYLASGNCQQNIISVHCDWCCVIVLYAFFYIFVTIVPKTGLSQFFLLGSGFEQVIRKIGLAEKICSGFLLNANIIAMKVLNKCLYIAIYKHLFRTFSRASRYLRKAKYYLRLDWVGSGHLTQL